MIDDLSTLLPRIYAALDEHRFDDLAAFYTADVRAVTPGGELSGDAELVAQATRNHEGIPALQHLVTSVLIDEAEGDATIRANLVAVFAGEDGIPTFELGSVWRGRARSAGGVWQICQFSITPVWQRGTRPVR
jgi:hypothetical protein